MTPSNPSVQQTPPCRHFDTCGGCSLQHLTPQAYIALKQGILENIGAELGLDEAVILPMIAVGEHSRRRAEFKIAVHKGEVTLGFFTAKSHDVVALEECLISEHALMTLLPALKLCLQRLKKPGMVKAISLTALDAGLDAIIITRAPLSEADRKALIVFAKTHGILRLSERERPPEAAHPSSSRAEDICLYDSGNASISFAGVDVLLPTGAFLQATLAGQMAITDHVTNYLSGCERVADLYAGCGTYSFPLIRQAKSVTAFEGSEAMVAALHNAMIKNDLDSRMTASVRDLFARPLRPYELNRFDGIVINPPRGGALPQVKHIAASKVQKIVMVSCNPATFKRDAEILLSAGYRITMAVPIDQFYWSSHLELVAGMTYQPVLKG